MLVREGDSVWGCRLRGDPPEPLSEEEERVKGCRQGRAGVRRVEVRR